MDLELGGARALVTGGSRGLGLAAADALAREGAAIGLVARNPAALDRAAASVGRHGHPVVTVAADVTDPDAVAAAVGEVADRLGGLDALVANVGGTVGTGNLVDSTVADFTATYALNAGHAVGAVQAALPHFDAAGGGSVVIVASITGTRPGPRTAYAAAKAAEIHLAATLALELAPRNVRVNAVSPGSILFEGGGWAAFRDDRPEQFARFVREDLPLGRLGRAEEVGDVVVFLLSKRASWITGANIPVDGAQINPSASRYT
jgi:3-oxoacyl-[acyl-carrier protein] reductase